jgi:hypothetical protein
VERSRTSACVRVAPGDLTAAALSLVGAGVRVDGSTRMTDWSVLG